MDPTPLTHRRGKRLNNPAAHLHQGTAAPVWGLLRFEILQALATSLRAKPCTCKRLKRAFQTLPNPQLWPAMRVQVPIGVNESSLGIIDSQESCGQDCNRKTNNVTRAQK